jgi:gluconolactonase
VTDLIEAHDAGIFDLVARDATVERVATGLSFVEGPIWDRDALLFSDIPNHRIVRWRELPEGPEVTTFATGPSNGLALDLDGSILVAEDAGRRVSRIATDGSRTVLAEHYQGKRLNSPNDIVVKSDGSIYFTDPPFGFSPTPTTSASPRRDPDWWAKMIPGKELTMNGVYRLTPDGRLTLLAENFATPNGLAFSPDEKKLYVDDSVRRQLRVFEVMADGTVSNGRVLVDMSSPDAGVPDGMKVDAAGNIFVTGPGGIWVCRPNGEVLGRLRFPELPTNLAWGEDGQTLFVTARTSVYRVRMQTRGRVAQA